MAKNDKTAEATAIADTGPEIVNKLSVKKILGKLPKPEKATALFVAIGIVDGVKSGTSTYGEWEALTGQFEVRVSMPGAENQGKAYFGTSFFPPKTAHEIIAGQFKSAAKAAGGEVTGMQFAVAVGYKPAENNMGYEYTVKPLTEVSTADPLAALRQTVAHALPALPAPK